MTARTIVITGASDGIGASAARTFSKQGEQVVVVGRSAEKTQRIAEEIGADYFIVDFADLAQVRQLAAQVKEKYPRIDVLANNAGGIMGKRELTVDGHEKTFQVNHLAPFLLTTELMDVLTASNATVINTPGRQRIRQTGPNDLETANKYSASLAAATPS
jgi:NAD(P)-dependent dehydrogenase (short-subunit alcohol dehydrogenase family)